VADVLNTTVTHEAAIGMHFQPSGHTPRLIQYCVFFSRNTVSSMRETSRDHLTRGGGAPGVSFDGYVLVCTMREKRKMKLG
jgi:hypothetical protein